MHGGGPAVVADMEDGRMVGVLRMIEQRDSFTCRRRDGSGVIDPAGRLLMNLPLVDRSFAIANRSAAVVNADRLGHPHAHQAEIRFAKRYRLLGSRQHDVEHQQPLALRLRPKAHRSLLLEQRLAVEPHLGLN